MAAYNSQQASLRVFIAGNIFISKKVYLSGKNSVPFPQRRPAGETLSFTTRANVISKFNSVAKSKS